MKLRWISVILALALVVAVFAVLPVPLVLAATTYSLAGQPGPRPDEQLELEPGAVVVRLPANFTSGDVFVIQNGHRHDDDSSMDRVWERRGKFRSKVAVS